MFKKRIKKIDAYNFIYHATEELMNATGVLSDTKMLNTLDKIKKDADLRNMPFNCEWDDDLRDVFTEQLRSSILECLVNRFKKDYKLVDKF